MELRKTDSEDLPRANCTGAVHRCIRPQSFCSSPSDHRASSRLMVRILKLRLGQRGLRLTGCTSFARFIRNLRPTLGTLLCEISNLRFL